MKIKIRAGEILDVPWIVEELREFSKLLSTKRQLFGSEEFAREVVTGLIKFHFLVVADTEDFGPVGFISGLKTTHMFNPKIRLLHETFWWVKPEFRGSPAGALLLDELIKTGKDFDWVTIATPAETNIADGSFERRGFKRLERSYLMEMGV